MLKNLTEAKKEKPKVFQVLLLNDDSTQEVEVRETEQVDFLRVQRHLKYGGSVFITSKNSQKLSFPKGKTVNESNSTTRKVRVF